jgi:hypothetical protein
MPLNSQGLKQRAPQEGALFASARSTASDITLPVPPWLVALMLGCLLLGAAGFSGSSSWAQSVADPLLEPEVRARRAEIIGRSRAIRSDEYGVELPLERSQQLATPSFPLVNLGQGLGQLQRNAYTVPVLDWGLIFRPLSWPLFLGARWSLGMRWFLRTALTLLGVFAWMRALTGTSSSPSERRKRGTLLGLCAVAVFYSSAMSWWMSTSLPEIVGFAGLGIAAVERSQRASTRRSRLLEMVTAGWFFACAFFDFYPPVWGPTLWIICATLFDLHWRPTHSVRRTVLGAAPYVAVLAVGVVLSLAYYSPYLAAVRDTVYPGDRTAIPGLLAPARLLDLVWPSLLIVGAAARPEQYLGAIPGMNVCEASAVEVLPLLPIAALAVLDRRARAALRRASVGAPAMLCALALLAAWLLIPAFPSWLGTAALLRWSPSPRTWFTFSFALAIFGAVVVAELGDADGANAAHERRGVAWWNAVVVAVVLGGTWWMGQRLVAVRLVPPSAVHHAVPMVLFAALMLAGALAMRSRAAASIVAAAWAVPLVAANFAVNPLVRSSDLAREGTGHRVVSEALSETPGRVVHYATHGGTYPNAFGWPLLVGVEQAPDVHLFRYLAQETPGLTEEVFNRYAHVVAILPPEPARLMQPDVFRLPVDPCSPRIATLGVNHFLINPEYAKQVPERCARSFFVRRAGDLVLWTRQAPVGPVGIARIDEPHTSLDFDFAADAARGVHLEPRRDGLAIDVPAEIRRPVAFAINRSLLERVECARGRVTEVDAHVVVWPSAGRGARCELKYLDSLGALRRLLSRPRPGTLEPGRSASVGHNPGYACSKGAASGATRTPLRTPRARAPGVAPEG